MDLPLETDADPDLNDASALAEEYGLPFYHALYLKLASRRSAQLASLDAAVLQAARARSSAVIDAQHHY